MNIQTPVGTLIARFARYALLLVVPAIAFAAQDTGRRDTDAGLVRVEETEIVLSPVGHIVLLKAQNMAVPIFVDAIVAQSIQGALTGEKYPRPLTHDLMRSVLEGFDGKVSRVVITLKGSTYYADLTVLVRGTTKVFDSRSSDAIALAIHFKAPVLVSRETFEKAGRSLETQPAHPGPASAGSSILQPLYGRTAPWRALVITSRSRNCPMPPATCTARSCRSWKSWRPRTGTTSASTRARIRT